MRPVTPHLSIERLLLSVKKLEQRMRAVGVPLWMARLPVWILSWYYCRLLDEKIARMRRVLQKFRKWLSFVHGPAAEGRGRSMLIDIDQSMQRDIEVTRRTLWELRGICIDVGQLFDSLGYGSAALRRRRDDFLRVVGESYETAGILQQAMAEHDSGALLLLRQMQEQGQAASD